MRTLRHLGFSSLLLSFACSCATKNQRAINEICNGHREYLVARYALPRDDLVKEARESEKGRNEILNDLILLVDMNYHEIEKRLYGGKSWSDFLSSTAIIGINTAGALTAGKE